MRIQLLLASTVLFAATLHAQTPELDGRMTPAQRAAAGVGAPITPLPPASAATQTQRLAAWRAEIRHQLFIPAKLPVLAPKVWSTFSPTQGVLADRVTYATADGMLVPAIVYRPDPKRLKPNQKLPGLVLISGHGSDKFGWYAFYSGMMFAKMGAVVVTYDMMGEGERSSTRASRTGEHDAWVSPPAPLPRTDWGQRLGGLMQVDAMQAVSYLLAQPQVDPARIAVAGFSMGSFVAGITGAIDTRIHAILLTGGGDYDGLGGYFDANPLPCQMPPYKSLLTLGDRGGVLYALNADRGPMFVMNGDDDTVMDMAHHPAPWFAELHERAATLTLPAARKNLFTTVRYPGVSHRPNWVNRDGVAWLNGQLHFPLITPEQIATAPTTHIGDWLKANNVFIAESYNLPSRDAGLDALGTGLPGIPREQLMVLPEADWQRMKDHLIYAAWAEKTKAAEAQAASNAKK